MIPPVDALPDRFEPAVAPPGLDPVKIARAALLAPDRVEVVDTIASTSTELMSRPGSEPPGTVRVLVAQRQLAGRGRQGRVFLSDPEDSLTFSIALERRRAPGTPPLVGLPLALGVAVARCAAGYVDGIGLKWPNDLLRHGRKCAGMLVEARTSAMQERVVIGLGVNLRLSPSIAARLDQPVTGLFDEAATAPPREALIGELARALIDAAEEFFVRGFGDTAARWAPFDAFAGRDVNILEGGRIILSGRAAGLDPTGALRLQTPSGVVAVAAGDVSARAADPAR